MSLLNVMDLTHGYAGRPLFEHVGFQINPGDKIGLVGPNGSGKTSLLRLLNRETTPESGSIKYAEGVSIGYLPQDLQESLEGELLKYIRSRVPGRVRLMAETERLEGELEKGPPREEQERLAAKLAELHAELGHLETRYPRHEAEKILVGLGFSENEFSRPVSTLSGGWKMRAALAGILFGKPDLILLDEPTNHLDIPSVRWLEKFLKDFRGALILVCHDREFLNRSIDRVISFEQEGLRFYKGNYEEYLEAREEEQQTLENRAKNQEVKVKEARKFIERFRYKASKARQAQSKIKLVEKMEIIKTHKKTQSVRFRFPEVERSGRVVADMEGLSKRYGDLVLYEGLDLKILRGERIALIGPNGAGKTTLLRMVEGEIKPDKGRIQLGHGVTKSFYAQHHSEMLNPKQTVLDEVYRIVPQESQSVVRGICGAFLFSGEDVDKPVGVLSGGERARVCLARILVNPGNFLIMDEPTNHLDLLSSEALIEALAEYNGTLLFVSHNQAFINRLATKIWDLNSGKVVEYPGGLKEYYDHLERSEISQGTEASEKGTGKDERPLQSRKEMRRQRAEQRRQIQQMLLPLRESLAGIEESIQELEGRQKVVEQELADPEIFRDETRSVPLLKEYDRIKNNLEALLNDWEEVQEKLERASKELEKNEV